VRFRVGAILRKKVRSIAQVMIAAAISLLSLWIRNYSVAAEEQVSNVQADYSSAPC